MAKKKADNTAEIGFEQQIWSAADKLRGNIDASEYKNVVLGLIFLKYISDKFDQRYQELVEEGEGFEEDRDEYAYKGIFWVPPTARWHVISAAAHTPEIGKAIDDAMRQIEKENPSLTGILPKNFARHELDKRRLGEIVDLFTNVKMHGRNDDVDLLGRSYEYCLSKFAAEEGKNAGQFYTPSCVVKTLVEVVEPYHGRVYDPCCGSGGMFVQSADFIRRHAGNINDVSIYGQESNPTTWKLAQMNLAIRGITADLGPHNADTFHEDLHKDKRFDYILANPPFNDGDWGGDSLANDSRWDYGVPPASNANFAWVEHMLHHLTEKGSLGLVLANTSLSIANEAEYEIRKAIIEDGIVECIVSLPAQLFYSTKIKVSLWFMRRGRDNQDETLFIDATKLGHMTSRTLRKFSDDDISAISETVKKFRKKQSNLSKQGFCQVVDREAIRGNNYDLTPSKYVLGSTLLNNVGSWNDCSNAELIELEAISTTVSGLNHELQEIVNRNRVDAPASHFKEIGLPSYDLYTLEDLIRFTEIKSEKKDLRAKAANLAESLSAQLFNHWFVDYEFPNERSLSYRANGGKLKDTELGKIPEAWSCLSMGALLKPRTEKVGNRENVPVYSTTNNGVFPRSEKFSKKLSQDNSKYKIIEKGDIVFGMSREVFNFGVMKDAVGSVSPAYHVYRVDEQIMNAEFLEIYMRYCPDYFRSLIKPGTREGQVLDKAELERKPLMVPPLNLQLAFVLIKAGLVEDVITSPTIYEQHDAK